MSDMKERHDRAEQPGDKNPVRAHPTLSIVLFFFMFAPAVAAEIGFGRVLTYYAPRPNLPAILVGAPLLIGIFILAMLFGATVWLLVMKPFVQRSVLARFFLSPNVPGFSKICAWIFGWTYRSTRQPEKPQ